MSTTPDPNANGLPDKSHRFAQMNLSQHTLRAYAYDWSLFQSWCQQRGLSPLPADVETLIGFLEAQVHDGVRASTLSRRLSAIQAVHAANDQPSAVRSARVNEVIRGIRRCSGGLPARKVPAVANEIKRMVDVIDVTSLHGLRDRALLLVGFAGAFRRSELVALEVEDIHRRRDDAVVTLRNSKPAETVAVRRLPDNPYCPLAALDHWCREATISNGPIFRRIYNNGRISRDHLNDRQVARIVKKYASEVGLLAREYAGHSLRSGFITSAGARHARIEEMANHSRHKSLDNLRRYTALQAWDVENPPDAGLLDE